MSFAESAPLRRSPVAPILIGLSVVAVAAVGGLATDTTSEWYRTLDRPSFQPPGAVFGPVWTVLYIALGISAWRAWATVTGDRRTLVLGLFAANFVLNAAWTAIFFAAEQPTIAGVEILVLLGTIVALVGLLWNRNRLAAALLLPYGAWVTFASVLTWTIAINN